MGIDNAALNFNGNRLQMWGLGSAFDTQGMLDVELEMLKLKNQPLVNQQGYYKQEKEAWASLKSAVTEFQNAVKTVKDMKLQGKNVTNSSSETVNVTASSSASDSSYSIKIEQMATAQKVVGAKMASSTDPLGKTGTVLINGKNFDFSSDMSLTQVVEKINEGSYGVGSSVINGHFILTSSKTGEANGIKLGGDTDIWKELGILDDAGVYKNEIQKARDSIAYIDGVEVGGESNVLTGVVTGLTIELKKTMTETETPVAFSVESNRDAMKDKIGEFVKSYNKLISKMNVLTGKEGLLQGKSAAMKAKLELGNALLRKGDSALLPYQIGIETDGTLKDGSLVYKAEKLSALLEKDSAGVMKLLTSEGGFIEVISDKMNDLIKTSGVLDTKMDGLERNIKTIDGALKRNEQLFEQQKETLVRKYAMFELMMANLNSQSDYMTAQLESLKPSKE